MAPTTIEYLSRPKTVSMADHWFEFASLEHFWIERRFRVLQKLAGEFIKTAGEMAEVGCGNGLLQTQIETSYQRSVTGLDLNEYALKRNQSNRSRVCCYDILDKSPGFERSFDVIFLFDVLEHIANEDTFVDALLFHLTTNGKIIVNLPAGPWAFSAYDRAAGHLRRYLIGSLRETARRTGLSVAAWTYWGLTMVPTLAIRKVWLATQSDENSVIRRGFDPGAPWLNRALGFVSKLEPIPQKMLGTSLLAILQRRTPGGEDGT